MQEIKVDVLPFRCGDVDLLFLIRSCMERIGLLMEREGKVMVMYPSLGKRGRGVDEVVVDEI